MSRRKNARFFWQRSIKYDNNTDGDNKYIPLEKNYDNIHYYTVHQKQIIVNHYLVIIEIEIIGSWKVRTAEG